jgi:uncharacterized membrane protein YgcG
LLSQTIFESWLNWRCNFADVRYISFDEQWTPGESDARWRQQRTREMKCPACRTVFSGPVPQCPTCKLSLLRLDAKFGAVPRHTRYLSDRSGRLPLREIKKLRALLQIFEKKFPQSLFSVFVTNGVPSGLISEYAFWLANRTGFSSIEAVAGDNFDLLLGIDVEAGMAALIIGYGLENYLTEDDLQAALAVAENAFRAGDFSRGIRECVESVMNRMREIARASEAHKRVGDLAAAGANNR